MFQDLKGSDIKIRLLQKTDMSRDIFGWRKTHFNRDTVHIQKKTLIRKLYTHCKIKLNFVQILNYYLHTHCHWTGGNHKAESIDRKDQVYFLKPVFFFCCCCREATLYNSASEHN